MLDTSALILELVYGALVLAASFAFVSYVFSSSTQAKVTPRENVRRAVPLSRDDTSQPLDPLGSSNWLKTQAALGMASIAARREARKASKWDLNVLERFHACDLHEFWNESYYWNGCDLKSRDRIISRISHRGVNAEQSFVFLLLDLADYGELTLEVDDLDWRTEQAASASKGGETKIFLPPAFSMSAWIRYNPGAYGTMASCCVVIVILGPQDRSIQGDEAHPHQEELGTRAKNICGSRWTSNMKITLRRFGTCATTTLKRSRKI